MSTPLRTLTTPDGRQLEYLVTGPDDGPALVFHSGTPSPAVDFGGITGPAAALGLRTISYSRPGYGGSSELRGRSVGDAAADVAALLDHLGVGQFRTLGWSGGGPHALACAALQPDRCRAAAIFAGLAPYPAPGLDFMAGMDEANIEEFGAAIAGFDVVDALLQPMLGYLQEASADSMAADMGGLLSDADRAALTGGFAEEMAGASRRAVQTGVGGWRDDDLAFASSWGFAVGEIAVPVAVWQGDQDRMVPSAHGDWLAAAIPTATAHRLPGEGHLALIAHAHEVLADLVSL